LGSKCFRGCIMTTGYKKRVNFKPIGNAPKQTISNDELGLMYAELSSRIDTIERTMWDTRVTILPEEAEDNDYL